MVDFTQMLFDLTAVRMMKPVSCDSEDIWPAVYLRVCRKHE